MRPLFALLLMLALHAIPVGAQTIVPLHEIVGWGAMEPNSTWESTMRSSLSTIWGSFAFNGRTSKMREVVKTVEEKLLEAMTVSDCSVDTKGLTIRIGAASITVPIAQARSPEEFTDNLSKAVEMVIRTQYGTVRKAVVDGLIDPSDLNRPKRSLTLMDAIDMLADVALGDGGRNTLFARVGRTIAELPARTLADNLSLRGYSYSVEDPDARARILLEAIAKELESPCPYFQRSMAQARDQVAAMFARARSLIDALPETGSLLVVGAMVGEANTRDYSALGGSVGLAWSPLSGLQLGLLIHGQSEPASDTTAPVLAAAHITGSLSWLQIHVAFAHVEEQSVLYQWTLALSGRVAGAQVGGSVTTSAGRNMIFWNSPIAWSYSISVKPASASAPIFLIGAVRQPGRLITPLFQILFPVTP